MVTGGYTKLFSSILMSSIWEEPSSTRIVWMTLLALCDQYGHVDGTVKSLARVARVTVDEAQAAIETFLSPDPDDRSGVAEGRRIVAENGGWTLVNHATYRDRMTDEDRRERDRKRKQAARGGSPNVSDPVHVSADIPECPQVSASVREFQHQIRSDSEQKREERPSIGRSTVLDGSLHRDHLEHSECSPNFAWCVPRKIHDKLVAAYSPKVAGDREAAARALRAWYVTVWAKLEPDFVMGDAWKFWQGAFDAAHATPQAREAAKRPEPVSVVPSAAATRAKYLGGEAHG